MLRHLLAVFIRNQRQKILSPKRATRRSFDLLTKHALLRRLFNLVQVNRQSNFLLGTSASNPSIRMSPRRNLVTKPASPEQREEVIGGPESPDRAQIRHPSIGALDDESALDDLRRAYSTARKESASEWLHYANKSCYIYLYRGGGEPCNRMAAFDLDGTIIKPKSNKRIPRSATDWDFFSVWTKIKLQQVLRENQARFVIFTNQNGVGLEIVPLDEVQKRIELVTKKLDIPCTVFMAIQKDEFRKPRTGMFKLFEASFNDSKAIDLGGSFYCGDAVGYPSHSDADIRFAESLELPFLPPDKFVRGVKPKKLTTVNG